MKKLLIMCTLLASVASAEIPNLETFKKNLKNGTEAVKKIFPYAEIVKDKNDRGVDGFKVVVPPECILYAKGYACDTLLIFGSVLALEQIPSDFIETRVVALLAALNIALPLISWHPKSKSGPYFAAGTTTAASIAAITLLICALTS